MNEMGAEWSVDQLSPPSPVISLSPFSYIYINLIPEVRGLSADAQERNEQIYSITPSWTAMSKALLPGMSNGSPDL